MLYDTYYFAIQQSLRPITKAFILALLPGLEEENGEFFDQVSSISSLLSCQFLTVPQVLHLLDRLSTTVTQSFFLQNLWLSMLTTQSARAPALHYLARRMPKLSGEEGTTP